MGEAGSVAVSLGDGPRVYLTGTVSLDAGALHGAPGPAATAPTSCGRSSCTSSATSSASGTSTTTSQLLYPKAQEEVTDYAAGDLTGLSRLGERRRASPTSEPGTRRSVARG